MRSVDGIQVLNAAKGHPRAPSVILLTGYGSLETSIAALRSGASDYLLKPYDPAALLASVAKVIQQRAEQLRQADAIQTIVQGLDQLRSGTAVARTISDNPTTASQLEERYLTIGQLSIDYFRHTAAYNGQPLHLTPIEYDLLSCLAEAQGRVLSYSEIVRRTHHFETSEIEAQTLIKAHVRNLRRKIDPRYLVNVRGTGYAMGVPEETAS